jgi:hypothetical protein
MKFSKFFPLLWVIFALLDPYPDPEYGSTDLIKSGSNTDDPDPKHWLYFLCSHLCGHLEDDAVVNGPVAGLGGPHRGPSARVRVRNGQHHESRAHPQTLAQHF